MAMLMRVQRTDTVYKDMVLWEKSSDILYPVSSPLSHGPPLSLLFHAIYQQAESPLFCKQFFTTELSPILL